MFSKYTQGFCTYCSLCLECSSATLVSVRSLSKCYFLREAFFDHPLKNATSPPLALRVPFPCYFILSRSPPCNTLCILIMHVCCYLIPLELSSVKTRNWVFLFSCSRMSQRTQGVSTFFSYSLRLAPFLVSRGPLPFRISHADSKGQR